MRTNFLSLPSGRRDSLGFDNNDNEIVVSEMTDLGKYLKFVNREKSINELLKHCSQQYYVMYGNSEKRILKSVVFASCSGTMGLGKTTFARKAFNKADSDQNDKVVWDGVDSNFKSIVRDCVENGRQFRISCAHVEEHEAATPWLSFICRLLCTWLNDPTKTSSAMKDSGVVGDVQSLIKVMSLITGNKKDSLVVVNLDETNEVMRFNVAFFYDSYLFFSRLDVEQ